MYRHRLDAAARRASSPQASEIADLQQLKVSQRRGESRKSLLLLESILHDPGSMPVGCESSTHHSEKSRLLCKSNTRDSRNLAFGLGVGPTRLRKVAVTLRVDYTRHRKVATTQQTRGCSAGPLHGTQKSRRCFASRPYMTQKSRCQSWILMNGRDVAEARKATLRDNDHTTTENPLWSGVSVKKAWEHFFGTSDSLEKGRGQCQSEISVPTTSVATAVFHEDA